MDVHDSLTSLRAIFNSLQSSMLNPRTLKIHAIAWHVHFAQHDHPHHGRCTARSFVVRGVVVNITLRDGLCPATAALTATISQCAGW